MNPIEGSNETKTKGATVVERYRTRATRGTYAATQDGAGAGLASTYRVGCADGADNKAIAARQRVTPQALSKWRARFVEHGLDGLRDTLHPGASRSIDDVRMNAGITKTCESVPAGATTHWSTRSMAREMDLSQTTVSRIWRAFALQPHRQETFKLSSDPLFVEKVQHIVGLYLDPPPLRHASHNPKKA